MKIILSKDDVMEILCKKFDLSYIYDSEEKVMKLKYTEDEIYWEGNPILKYIQKKENKISDEAIKEMEKNFKKKGL